MSECVLTCEAAPFLSLWLVGAGFGCSISCLCHWHGQVASFHSSKWSREQRKSRVCFLGALGGPPRSPSRVSALNTSCARVSALLVGRKRGTLITLPSQEWKTPFLNFSTEFI